jgi:hypothetical protein
VLCDGEIGIVIFNSSGQLCQYASGDMERLLERYSKACAEPHERSTNDEVRGAPAPGRAAGAAPARCIASAPLPRGPGRPGGRRGA